MPGFGKSGTSRIFARSSSADTKPGPPRHSPRGHSSRARRRRCVMHARARPESTAAAFAGCADRLPFRRSPAPPRAAFAEAAARAPSRAARPTVPATIAAARPGPGPAPARTEADTNGGRHAEPERRPERVGQRQPGGDLALGLARHVAQDDQRELGVGQPHPVAAEREDRHREPRRHPGQEDEPEAGDPERRRPGSRPARSARAGSAPRAAPASTSRRSRTRSPPVSARPAAAADQPRTSTSSSARTRRP